MHMEGETNMYYILTKASDEVFNNFLNSITKKCYLWNIIATNEFCKHIENIYSTVHEKSRLYMLENNIKEEKEYLTKYKNMLGEDLNIDGDLYPIPLERQVNVNLYELTLKNIIELHNNLIEIRNIKRSIYYILNSHVLNLTIDLSYVRHKLINFELTSRNNYEEKMNEIILKLKKKYNDMNKKFNFWNVKMVKYDFNDNLFIRHLNIKHFETYVLEKRYNYKYNHQYDLPVSVLNDSANDTNIWPIVCQSNTIFGKLPIFPPL